MKGLDFQKVDRSKRLSAGRQPWVRPTLSHLDAGRAEDASGPSVDLITNPS